MTESPPKYQAEAPAYRAGEIAGVERIVFVEALFEKSKNQIVSANLTKSASDPTTYHRGTHSDTRTCYVELVSIRVTENMTYRELTDQLVHGVVNAGQARGRNWLSVPVLLQFADVVWDVEHDIYTRNRKLQTRVPRDDPDKLRLILRKLEQSDWKARFVIYCFPK